MLCEESLWTRATQEIHLLSTIDRSDSRECPALMARIADNMIGCDYDGYPLPVPYDDEATDIKHLI